MSNTIALIFDFDDTLTPDSTTGFLGHYGVDVGEFWGVANKLIEDDGWDPMPVYLYKMLELSRNTDKAITRESLNEYGKSIQFYEGVEEFFPRIRKYVESLNPDVNIEFYIISSGIGEILRASKIANEFNGIWACDFHFEENGAISFPKNVVSFTEKTRFLFHISKGITETSRTNPYAVNDKVEDDGFKVPFKNMIYIGDGLTDVPCFKLIKRYHGIPLAVIHDDKIHKWKQGWGLVKDERVATLLPADYKDGSALDQQVKVFISAMIKEMATG